MKYLFSILIFFIVFQGYSCHRAYQYRVFPIGYTGSCMYLMEIELIRSPRDKNVWEGTAHIATFQGNKIEKFAFIDSVKISSNNYSNDLLPYFDSAVSITDTISGLIRIDEIENEFCMFREKSGPVKLNRINKEEFELSVEDKTIPLKLPNVLLAEKELISAGGWGEPFGINSFRTFTLGEKRYFIVNVGTGEKESTKFKEELKKQMKYLKTELYPELTLYHGFCYDTIIVL